MNSTWASRRKLIYALIAIGVLILLIIIPSFLIFYKAPTCFDGKQNGGEYGVDCGGSCRKLCQSAFLSPRIEWGGAKIEKITNGLYNIATYISNPNINGAAVDVPYTVSLYDAQGVYITKRDGVVTLYPRRSTLAFQTAVNTEKRIPAKATFEFISAPVWFKSSDALGGIAIIDKKYIDSKDGSSLEVVLENKTLTPYENIQVSVVLYDAGGNAIGFSQTVVDSLPINDSRNKNISQIATYTWPISRDGRVVSVEVIPSIKPIPAN